ncbi:hypothetical protein K501DRAFT_277233 [Backusella circina FSU 941]|nr:hypothetical protein K501DRAFT_277233 [Backusella circina FSU 941]
MDFIPRAFNLKENLQILFVDLNCDDQNLYCCHSRIWEILNQVGQLHRLINRSSLGDFQKSLYRNQFGFLYIEYEMQIQSKTPQQIQNNFMDLVKRIRPQLLVVLGRNTYQAIFQGLFRTDAVHARWGLSEATINWVLRKGRKGKTFVFLMNRTTTFDGIDYQNCMNDLMFMRPILTVFKVQFPTLPPKNQKEYTNQQIENGQQFELRYQEIQIEIENRVVQRLVRE